MTEADAKAKSGLITGFFQRVPNNQQGDAAAAAIGKQPSTGAINNKRSASRRDETDPSESAAVAAAATVDADNGKRSRLDAEALAPERRQLLSLELDTMSPEWQAALSDQFQQPYFLALKKFLHAEQKQGRTILPPLEQVYSWSHWTLPQNVRVVILGQDPYHDIGQAHGLCFSVTPGTRIPPSLVNIYKGIQQDIPEFQAPKHGYLAGWAKQGVLLLNAVLTVRAHQANSHAGRGWENFTDAVVDYINKHCEGVVFMLWGAHAQKKGRSVDKRRHLVLTAVHPSPLSAYRGATFFNCRHFTQANAYLSKHGKPEIRWSDLPVDIAPPVATSNVTEAANQPNAVLLNNDNSDMPLATAANPTQVSKSVA